MGIEILLLLLVVAGIIVSFKLRGAAARRARKGFAIGLALALGGCWGSISWLSGETRGTGNWATEVNPYLFAGLFILGMLVMVFTSARVLADRRKQLAASDQGITDDLLRRAQSDDQDSPKSGD